jgi:hypothetical protein
MLTPFGLVRFGGRVASAATISALETALDSRLAEAAADRIVASRLVEHVVTTVLRGPLLEASITAAGPDLERIADHLMDSPAAERLVARVIQGRLLEEAVSCLLESEELWVLVDEIARSPAVTDAISHQSAGLAEEVSGVVRRRSRLFDAQLERTARRVLRRRTSDGTDPAPAPQ